MTGPDLPVIVIPCFNEERRLEQASQPRRPGTGPAPAGRRRFDRRTLATSTSCATLERRHVLELAENQGKAEAVRPVCPSCRDSATVAGHYDADLRDPPAELLGLIESSRNDLGRVRAGLTGCGCRADDHLEPCPLLPRPGVRDLRVAWRSPVYDTQCGAKVFRGHTEPSRLDRPFRSAWVLMSS